MGASGDPNLGGEDWDRALVDWFVEAVDASVDAVDGTSVGNLQDSVVKDNSGNAEEASLKITPLHVSPKVSLRVSLRDSRKLHENVLREMEVAKRVLSDKQSVEVWMFWGLDDSGNGGARQRKVVSVQTETRDASEPSLKRIHATTKITVTRENLASATVHLTNRSVPPIYDALKRAGNVRVDEISNVVLVGGSSRLVSVRQRLVEIFGTSKVLTDANGNGIDPETAVALGAARSHAC
jgi:molecular chaperone DnaK (HSP70)